MRECQKKKCFRITFATFLQELIIPCKDIVRLADILGHSNINTTRIYTAESGTEHMKQLQKLGLLRC